MNTRLHFENLTHLVFAFLTFLFLIFAYSFTIINEDNDEDESEITIDDTVKLSPTIQLGKNIFKNKCGSCHAKNMKTKTTGPALANIQDRWKNQEDLYAWIRNSQAFLTTGDEYANQLFLENNGNIMTAFPELSDTDINSILEYIDFASSSK